MIAASHGKRAILRLEHDGRWATLVDRFNGKQLNSPNDVVVASDGNIWFTDPTFGILNPKESYGGTPVQGGEFIYRYDPLNNKLERIATPEVKSPNGLAFLPMKIDSILLTPSWPMILIILILHTKSSLTVLKIIS